MQKTEYEKKLKELQGQEVTMDNIFVGLIFRCSWGNMADYYEVIGKTAKSLKLREVHWESCSAEDAGQEPDYDPTWRWTRIARDAEGNAIPEKDFSGKEIVKMVRVKTNKKGGIYFRSPNYNGEASVRVCNSDYMHMYWG